MAKRRRGTIPQRVRLTQELSDLVDAYQEQHQIASFSAAIEHLARMGLQQSPTEIMTPVIVDAVQQAVRQEVERLVKLEIYGIVEAGVAQRLAGAALLETFRVTARIRELSAGEEQAVEARYDTIKRAAVQHTRRRLARNRIAEVVRELYEQVDDDAAGEDSEAEHGDR